MEKQQLGAWGEQRAAAYLATLGYTIVERNWRGQRSEIDIIARNDATLVLVEVRVRRGNQRGSAEESITPTKARRLVNALDEYVYALAERGQPWTGGLRIDIVAINLNRDGTNYRLNHLISAVNGE